MVLPVCFSPDETRLIAIRKDLWALYVWDLRLIREQLRELGLDWDWPPFPPPQPPTEPAPVRVEVNLGPQGAVRMSTPAEEVGLNTLLVSLNPFNYLAYNQLGEPRKAAADLERALVLSDGNTSPQPYPDRVPFTLNDVAPLCNHLAWALVGGPESQRDPPAALPLAEKAVALRPDYATYWNTLGVVYYRLGRYGQAVTALERSLSGGVTEDAPFDLLFLALCHVRLGQMDKARVLRPGGAGAARTPEPTECGPPGGVSGAARRGRGPAATASANTPPELPRRHAKELTTFVDRLSGAVVVPTSVAGC